MTRYRLRVSLVGSDPEIWRELDVRGGIRLRMLHIALQTVMGWRELHLHEFTDADPSAPPSVPLRRWGPPEFPDAAADVISENDVTVTDVLNDGGPLWYEYDSGDGWTHRIDVLDEREDAPELTSVVVLDGARRAPFEDSGGLDGYAEKLAIAADPTHPEHDDIVEWIHATVGPWAPQTASTFDAVVVQTELNLLFSPEESGFDPYDMSGLVKREELRRPGDVHDASPVVVLAAELPPPLRAELRQHLDRTGILEPTEIDPDTASRIIRPFGWLMDAIGPDGLALTSAGWMPPATVLAGMTELGWLDGWIGTGNREDLTPPIAVLRETATRIGLVRVQKGHLLLTAAAKRALGDPVLQLRLIAGGLGRDLGDAETDAATLLLIAIADGTEPAERWRAVAFGLEACGWASSTGRRFTERDIDLATDRVRQVLDLLGDSGERPGRSEPADPLLALFAREALR
ncbi:hypothetical protein M2317_003530 [Microbacterium sp. ZKA21]|uniref:plasmid pRiA4b ORF-3 family protein n=1 Tax=Microbacterium sp. ZKA21 TaxID=3381694 RepID=UPI003D208813